MIKLLKEEYYDLGWKEVGTETIYTDEGRQRLPIYEKRINRKEVIQVVPEQEEDYIVWTVYYTHEIGKEGFRLIESGFFDSEEAMGYVDKMMSKKVKSDDLDESPISESFSKDDDLQDLIQEFEQEYDSSVTSINSAKLPTIFGLVQKLGGFKQGTLNLDYGGGRFDNAAQYLKDYDVLNLVYDPFNRSKEHNKDVIDFVRNNGGADTVTCSNVLNVIKEPENRLSVIKNCDRLVKSGGTVYFTVYEGSGSGEGKANDKRKSYQTNMRTEDYQEELEQVFGSVTRKGKLFICK